MKAIQRLDRDSAALIARHTLQIIQEGPSIVVIVVVVVVVVIVVIVVIVVAEVVAEVESSGC